MLEPNGKSQRFSNSVRVDTDGVISLKVVINHFGRPGFEEKIRGEVERLLNSKFESARVEFL